MAHKPSHITIPSKEEENVKKIDAALQQAQPVSDKPQVPSKEVQSVTKEPPPRKTTIFRDGNEFSQFGTEDKRIQ